MTREPQWDDGALEALIDQANGRRTARRLDLGQVRACVAEALSAPLGFAWRHGGESVDARDFTTVCLAVAVDEGCTVGVAAARASAVSPARAWPELDGWDRFNDAANEPGCLAWAGRRRGDRVQLKYRRAAGAGATREDLLGAVLDRPDDDRPRLVFADWLTEHGDPRGELITLQCELQQLGEDDPRRPALEARAKALLDEHGDAWRGGLSREHGVAAIVRGFVGALSIEGSRLAMAEPLLRVEPVRTLGIAGVEGLDVARLAASPWLSRLRTLTLHGDPRRRLGEGELAVLLESRHLRSLRTLRLVDHRFGDGGAMLLAAAAGTALPELRRLELEQDEVSVQGLTALAATRWFGALEHLSLSDNRLRVESAEVLATMRSPNRLKVLDLSGNQLHDDGARVLARAERLGTLEQLLVARNRIGPAGAEALLTSPVLAGLERLDLRGNTIGQRARLMLEARFPQR